MISQENTIRMASILIERMERLAPDSIWARRTSGYRGTLLRLRENLLQDTEADGGQIETWGKFCSLVDQGFHMLEKAARNY